VCGCILERAKLAELLYVAILHQIDMLPNTLMLSIIMWQFLLNQVNAGLGVIKMNSSSTIKKPILS